MHAILKMGIATTLFTALNSIGVQAVNAQLQDYTTPPNPTNQNTTLDPLTSPNSPQPATDMAAESAYDRFMRLGYAALKLEDYPTALNYFRNALSVRPYDRLATISYWNAIDVLQSQEQAQEQAQPTNPGTPSDYDRYMRIGYDATDQGDYNTALINFRRALAERPGDPYASQALRNVRTYLWAERQVE